ncbi:MAG: hypothetical protein ISP80_02415 [Synechococcus sp. BS301-5m-G53]|nr:hypothetical protein [Synechococcus sp. BS301-5m-G53]
MALKVFIIIAWASACGGMVLQSPKAIVLILLFGIQAECQTSFARGAIPWA